MEQVMSFDEWYATDPNKIIQEQTYSILFDLETRNVLSVGPSIAYRDESNKIEIDRELAFDLLEGRKRLQNYFVDFDDNGDLAVIEMQDLFIVDNVIHKITPKQWVAEDIEHDIYLTFYSKSSTIKIELSKSHGGTKRTKKKSITRKTVWAGETKIKLLVTEYNDPHKIHEIIELELGELDNKSKTVKLKNLPKKFSVYTKRLFKNYVIEYK